MFSPTEFVTMLRLDAKMTVSEIAEYCRTDSKSIYRIINAPPQYVGCFKPVNLRDYRTLTLTARLGELALEKIPRFLSPNKKCSPPRKLRTWPPKGITELFIACSHSFSSLHRKVPAYSFVSESRTIWPSCLRIDGCKQSFGIFTKISNPWSRKCYRRSKHVFPRIRVPPKIRVLNGQGLSGPCSCIRESSARNSGSSGTSCQVRSEIAKA